jgi:hypothetical protein
MLPENLNSSVIITRGSGGDQENYYLNIGPSATPDDVLNALREQTDLPIASHAFLQVEYPKGSTLDVSPLRSPNIVLTSRWDIQNTGGIFLRVVTPPETPKKRRRR